LPEFSSRCITKDYLLACAKREVLTIAYEKVFWFTGTIKQKKTKAELFDILSIVSKDTKLGFTDKNPPDKAWLLNVIHTLDRDNAIFKTPDQFIQRVVPQE